MNDFAVVDFMCIVNFFLVPPFNSFIRPGRSQVIQFYILRYLHTAPTGPILLCN